MKLGPTFTILIDTTVIFVSDAAAFNRDSRHVHNIISWSKITSVIGIAFGVLQYVVVGCLVYVFATFTLGDQED